MKREQEFKREHYVALFLKFGKHFYKLTIHSTTLFIGQVKMYYKLLFEC